MPHLLEGRLRLQYPNDVIGIHFDQLIAQQEKLSHCMKSVDFVLQTRDRLIFVEVKDFDAAPTGHVSQAIRDFRQARFDQDLVYKFRDTFLYYWANGLICGPTGISVDYFVLVTGLSSIDLLAATDRLRKKLPLSISGAQRQLANRCLVLHPREWNHHFPNMPVTI